MTYKEKFITLKKQVKFVVIRQNILIFWLARGN